MVAALCILETTMRIVGLWALNKLLGFSGFIQLYNKGVDCTGTCSFPVPNLVFRIN